MCCVSRAMMMTACDLSAIAKPWEIQSKVRWDLFTWSFSFFALVVVVKWHSSLTDIQLFAAMRNGPVHRLCERGTDDKVDGEWHFGSSAISPSSIQQWLLTASCIKSNLVLFISLITAWQARHFISANYVIYTSPSRLHTQAYQYEQEPSLAARQPLPEGNLLPLFVCNWLGMYALFQWCLLFILIHI